jgi:hypothetical protein
MSTNTNMPETVAKDLQALAARSSRRLLSQGDTARALDAALARRARPAARRSLRRPLLAGAGALAAAALVLLVPVPYRHHTGWDAVLRSADGRTATVHLGARSAREAKERASQLARRTGANDVRIAEATQLVWGSVYAMAEEKLFHVDVDMAGKTDAEVEAEIRAQLSQQGWTPDEVQVQRDENGSTVSLGASDGDREIKIVKKQAGDEATRVDIQPVPIDDKREPGMTDEQLREKILRQLEAQGLTAEVTVNGDDIRIEAQKKQ